jgi:YggT family protein
MMGPFLYLINAVISLINFALITYVILSLLISFQIVNRRQPLVDKIYEALGKLLEPMLKPIRNLLPDLGGIDISPIILFLLLGFVRAAANTYLPMLA